MKKISICLIVMGVVAVVLFSVLIVAGLAVDHVFGKGIRDSALYRSESDNASQLSGGEVCATEHVDAFVFHLSNWDVVRTGGGAKPLFEEVGPYNLTRTVCTFDRHVVAGSNPPAVRFRKHHGPWSVVSKPADGGPGVDVNRKLNVVNPAYHGVMATLQRTSPTPLSGIAAETSLHAAITSGALKAVMDGILQPQPDGFLTSTFIGAIPTVLATVVATLDEKIPNWVPGTDADSPLIAAQYLWARPRDCGDFSRGTISCSYLKILDGVMGDGLPLDENDATKFDGYEVGSALHQGLERSTLTGAKVRQLWDTSRSDSLRSIDGIVLWNTSRTSTSQSLQLASAFNLTTDELSMVQRWVHMFSSKVTPALVTNSLLGNPGPPLKGYDTKQYLLAWKQLGEGTVSAQRGNRTDGLPKTIHDLNPRVPFEFEISHWARLTGVPLPLTTPWHLEFIFNGTTPEPPFTGAVNPKPLLTPEGITLLLDTVRAFDADPSAAAAAATCQQTWRMDVALCKKIGAYVQWFFEALIVATGPVVSSTALDILVDRADPLLTILKTAGRVASDRSGILYDAGDYESRAVAASQPFELQARIWDGTGEGGTFALSDSVPPGYTAAFERAEWATADENGTDFYVFGELPRTWAKPVQIAGSNGERFKFGLSKDDVLDVWNDRVARTLSWSYAGDAQLEGIDVWQFKLNDDEFAVDPVYYQSAKGMFNISGLSPADVFVSLPRFYGVDPLVHNVDVRPAPQELKCCTDWRIFVEPTSGVTMGKDVVTQINFKSPGFGAFKNAKLPPGYMPVVWLQDRVFINPDQAVQFKDGLSLSSTARTAAFVMAPVLLLLCACCIVFAHFRAKRSNPSADFDMH